MEYTNSIGDYNILTDFEISKNLVVVEMISFFEIFKYNKSKIDFSTFKHDASELVVVKIIKQGKDCTIFKNGELVLIDMVMLSQFAFIFENYPTIDPTLMIAPERLILARIKE